MTIMLTILLQKRTKGFAVPHSARYAYRVMANHIISSFLLVYTSKQSKEAMQRKLCSLLLRLPLPFYFAKPNVHEGFKVSLERFHTK